VFDSKKDSRNLEFCDALEISKTVDSIGGSAFFRFGTNNIAKKALILNLSLASSGATQRIKLLAK